MRIQDLPSPRAATQVIEYSGGSKKEFQIVLKVPPGIACERCVLQVSE